jgi:O-antigen/teichoic acid export membrane protein
MYIKTVLVVTLAQLINYGLPILTFPLLVKAFDINTYGIWIEVNTITSLAISFGILGLGNAVGVMIVEQKNNTDVVYSNALYAFLLLSTLLITLLIVLTPVLNTFTTRNTIAPTIFRISAFTILSGAMNLLASQVYRLRNRPFIGATFDIVIAIMRLVTAFIAFLEKDLVKFAVVFVTVQVLLSAFQLIVAYRGIILTRLSIKIIKSMAIHSFNLAIAGQANWLVMYGDRLLLSMLSTSSAVAVYAASYQFTMILVALGWPYLYPLLPTLGEFWKNQDIQGTQNAIKQATRLMALTIIPGIVGLALVGNSLLELLASKDFAQGILLIGFIACGVALDSFGTTLQYIFYTQGNPQVLRNIYFRAAIFNILSNLVAIPLLSYNGAGLTTLLTFAYIFYALWRKTEMDFTVLFDVRTIWRCLVASGIMGIWVIATVRSNFVGLTISIVGGGIIYGIGIIILRVITPDELLSIPRSILRRINILKAG